MAKLLIVVFGNSENAPKNDFEICGLTAVASHQKDQFTHFNRELCKKTYTQQSAFGYTIEAAISEVQTQMLVTSNDKAEGHGYLLLLLLNKKLIKK
jgi:uncharacterized protein YeaO (DUF488 family)